MFYLIEMCADHDCVILQPETILNIQICLQCKQGKGLFDLFQPADWHCAAQKNRDIVKNAMIY